MTTTAALEAAIDRDFEDRAAWTVYADWLQGRGDERGELIALALAGKDAEAEVYAAAHATSLLGMLAPHVLSYDFARAPAFTWRYGFIRAARLTYDSYAYTEKVRLVDVLRLLLDHPSGHFLAELAFAFNGDPNEDNLQDLIDLLASAPRPRITKLHLGDYKYAGARREGERGEDTEISWYSAGNLAALWPAVPNLETLIVQTGSATSAAAGGTQLGTLVAPRLRHFEWRTGGLERENARGVIEGTLPAIEHLDLWFGQDMYGRTATIEDAIALLRRRDLPRLRHLGIMNAEFADELVPELVRSPLLPQLTSLDLSLGCLSDAGAEAIRAERPRFQHLARLDVGYSYLTTEGARLLDGVAGTLVADEQRAGEGDDDRYAAVGE